jgi:GNAT superfamily N-acetyltransferase
LHGKANGRHRGEIVKLMVHRGARGLGLGRGLLDVAERSAVAGGVRLLLLDTETGSGADRLHQKAGWTRYGYAAGPDGDLQDGGFYDKRFD